MKVLNIWQCKVTLIVRTENKFYQEKSRENPKRRRTKSLLLSSSSQQAVKRVWLELMADKLLDLFVDLELNMMKTAFKEVRNLEWQQLTSLK